MEDDKRDHKELQSKQGPMRFRDALWDSVQKKNKKWSLLVPRSCRCRVHETFICK